jgi:hypothetical protein
MAISGAAASRVRTFKRKGETMAKTRVQRLIAVGLIGLPLVLSLAACGAGGKGGATTCGEYKAASDKAKNAAVTKMLEDHGGSTSNGNVTMTRASVRVFCETMGSDGHAIESVYG